MDEEPPLPPAPPSVWSLEPSQSVKYTVLDDWEWLWRRLSSSTSSSSDATSSGMTRLASSADLPSAAVVRRAALDESSTTLNGGGVAGTPAGTTPGSVRRRRQKTSRRDRGLLPALLRVEIVTTGGSDDNGSSTSETVLAAHGTSAALDGLEDKDELVRTLQRCRCDHLNLSPPTTLINWDVTHEECLNVIGKTLPVLRNDGGDNSDNDNADQVDDDEDRVVVAVLKEPMGTQGKGIFFVSNVEQIHEVINEHRQRALHQPNFLDNLIDAKGRIPSWVLQAEVSPSRLICGGRKFHIRSYVVVREKRQHDDLLDVFIFNRHEVRVAGEPLATDDQNGIKRDLTQHITNGAASPSSQRLLLDQVEELQGFQPRLEAFIAETFGNHLMQDILRRVASDNSSQKPPNNSDDAVDVRKFAIGGLDLMITESGRIYLLEVNVNPAAPKESTIDETFKDHLVGFFRDFVDLILGNNPSTFVNALDILQQLGLLEE